LVLGFNFIIQISIHSWWLFCKNLRSW